MWGPVLNPVIGYILDSQLMEGNTYMEHSALGVSLDSGPTEGASFLEHRKQSVPGSSLAVRPVEGVTEKVSEWKPVINPVISYTLDSRLMEGNAVQITFIFIDFRVCDFAFAFKTQNAPCVLNAFYFQTDFNLRFKRK